MDQRAEEYLKKSGLLDSLSQESVKHFFIDLLKQYKAGKMPAEQISRILDELLSIHLYDSEIEINDSALLSAMEIARELNEVESGSIDHEEGIMKPLDIYLSENETNS